MNTIDTLNQYEESSVSEQVNKLTTFLQRNADNILVRNFPQGSNADGKTVINKPKRFDNNLKWGSIKL